MKTKQKCQAHHWQIAPVEQKTSEGVCLKCGATKTFDNWKDLDPLNRNVTKEEREYKREQTRITRLLDGIYSALDDKL